MITEKVKKRYWYIAGLTIVIILLLMIIPIEIPDTITVEGKILAAREWIMIRQTDGSIMVSQRDNHNDFVSNYTAFQIDRGDVFQFMLNERFSSDRLVTAGDTLGRVFSHRLYQEISRLEGLMGVARANQIVRATGEKEAVISQAEDEFKLNVERAALQAKILERQTKLYNDALISNEEYEITSGLARIAELEVKVADARLKALKTGEKPAEIQLASFEIYAASRELNDLKNKLSRFTLIAPIDGEISTLFSSDTLLLVHSINRVVLMPVPYEYFNTVVEGKSFIANDVAMNEELNGVISHKGQMLKKLGTNQVFFVVGMVKEDVSGFPLGMISRCQIEVQPRLISDYIIRFIKTLFW